MTDTAPGPWDVAPDQARLDWHRAAAARDEARIAEGPDGDREPDDSPWGVVPRPAVDPCQRGGVHDPADSDRPCPRCGASPR
jgi:hypothetical protein